MQQEVPCSGADDKMSNLPREQRGVYTRVAQDPLASFVEMLTTPINLLHEIRPPRTPRLFNNKRLQEQE